MNRNEARGQWDPPSCWAVLVTVASIAVVLGAPSGLAKNSRPPPDTHPGVLWKAFPLEDESPGVLLPPTVTVPVRAAPRSVPSPGVVRSQPSSRPILRLSAVLVGALAAVGVAALLVRRARAPRLQPAPIAAVSRAPPSAGTTPAPTSVRPTAEPVYLCFYPGRRGYRLVERVGAPPATGELIVDDELGRPGQTYVVERVSNSPLPHDGRRCVMLRAL